MDRIKTVKIKNPDGSVSEETYTISIDAKNVDMDNGKELQETVGTIDIDTDGNIAEQLENLNNDINNINNNIDNLNIDIKKKAYFFDTVANMKNADLKIGDYVCTLGYYKANDDGAAQYKIVDTIDNSVWQETLNNNLYATLINEGKINILQLGGLGNDSFDNTDLAMQSINIFGYVYFSKGTYKCNIDIIEDIDVEIFGEKEETILKPYNSTKPIININYNFITHKKHIHDLNFYLIGTSNGIDIDQGQFRDVVYPNTYKLHNLHFDCKDTYAGDCIRLSYVNQANISDIYVRKAWALQYETTAMHLISCMAIIVNNFNFAYCTYGVKIEAPNRNNEGVTFINGEFFQCVNSIYMTAGVNKTNLDIRFTKLMMDQIRGKGIYIDGGQSITISECYFGQNVGNTDGIYLTATQSNLAWVSIYQNMFLCGSSELDEMKHIKIADIDNSRWIFGIKATNNFFHNYKYYPIDINNTYSRVYDLLIAQNSFNTSSQQVNKPLNYINSINKVIINDNINNGGGQSISDMDYIGRNIILNDGRVLTESDIGGSYHQNNSNKALVINFYITKTGNDVSYFTKYMGKSTTSTNIGNEKYDASGTYLQMMIIPPKWYFGFNLASDMTTAIYAYYI